MENGSLMYRKFIIAGILRGFDETGSLEYIKNQRDATWQYAY